MKMSYAKLLGLRGELHIDCGRQRSTARQCARRSVGASRHRLYARPATRPKDRGDIPCSTCLHGYTGNALGTIGGRARGRRTSRSGSTG